MTTSKADRGHCPQVSLSLTCMRESECPTLVVTQPESDSHLPKLTNLTVGERGRVVGWLCRTRERKVKALTVPCLLLVWGESESPSLVVT
jgi:hypothetical protein